MAYTETEASTGFKTLSPSRYSFNGTPYLMWFLPLLFFAYQFILRLWPGLLMQPLMAQTSMDASQFGFVAACYYFGYAGMQIPVAILLERFGARYMVCIFALICGFASLLFTYSENWYCAAIARFFVGAGSAVGILGVSKVLSEWFPQKQYTLLLGFSFTLGLSGAIYGGKPVSLLLDHYPWHKVALVLALIAIAIGLLSLFVLRSPRDQEAPQDRIKTEPFRWGHLKKVLASPLVWWLAIANLLMVGALEGFSDIWGVSFLMNAHGISKTDAAELVSGIFLGMLFGGPLLALCSKKISAYVLMLGCGLGMAIALLLVLLSPDYNPYALFALFFCIGVFCCYQLLVFSSGAALVDAHCLGVTIAFLNGVNMLGGSFYHALIGKLMDHFWTGALDAEGLRQYSFSAYQWALGSIPLGAALGALMVGGMGLYLCSRKS